MALFGVLYFIALLVGTGAQMNEQDFLRQECIRQCAGPQTPGSSRCAIAHPTNCFKYVICTAAQGSMLTQVMPCAFGTMRTPGVNTVCERAELVQCQYDACLVPNTTVYNHDDSNCRTHWKCVNGQSESSCCPRYHRFDPQLGRCERDIKCADSCPLLNDATCNGKSVASLNIEDGNCKTYWECFDGLAYPTCCKAGFGYDIFTSSCELNATCNSACPPGFGENCSLPNVSAYKFNETNCRTYMNCSKTIPGKAEPFCCRSGMMFSQSLKMCVDSTTPECFLMPCPHGYTEECRLEAIPGEPDGYKNLDSFGGDVMRCAVGTILYPEKCQCGPDLTRVPIVPGLGDCQMEIHAVMPNLKNKGVALAALLMLGEYGQGETGVGNMTTYWDGGDGINIPYFGSQAPSKLYIEITFTPSGTSTMKQVLVTSCRKIGNETSLEVSLMSNTGVMTTSLNTPGLRLRAVIEMPYQMNVTYTYKLIYNGVSVGVILAPTSGSPTVKTEPFSGVIPIDISGLRFAKCRHETKNSGLIGYVSEIKVSKCINPIMEQELAAIQPVAVQPVAVQPVAVQPVAVQPVAVQPVAVQPVAIQPVAVQPAVQPVAVQPVAVQPAVQPVAVQPVAIQPVAVQPVTVQPVTVQPVV